MTERILRLPAVIDRTGVGRSSLYSQIDRGLFPAGVPLGARMTGWPESEVASIIAARIRGASNDEIRALVSNLHAARKAAA